MLVILLCVIEMYMSGVRRHKKLQTLLMRMQRENVRMTAMQDPSHMMSTSWASSHILKGRTDPMLKAMDHDQYQRFKDNVMEARVAIHRLETRAEQQHLSSRSSWTQSTQDNNLDNDLDREDLE